MVDIKVIMFNLNCILMKTYGHRKTKTWPSLWLVCYSEFLL